MRVLERKSKKKRFDVSEPRTYRWSSRRRSAWAGDGQAVGGLSPWAPIYALGEFGEPRLWAFFSQFAVGGKIREGFAVLRGF